MAPDTGVLVAAIYSACWWVRHYARGGRSSIQRAERAQAIQRLGLTCRDALTKSDDFEPLLTAIVDGLAPRDDRRF